MVEVYSFKSNNSLSRDQLNYENGSVKNIHYGDIHTKFPTLFDITKQMVPFINPSESLEGFRPENDCAEGDMIFADASEDLEDIGKSIEIVRLNGERVVSGQHTILARPNDDSLVIGFGAYLFKSRRVRSQIQKESQGSKVLGISATRLTKIQLPIPSTKAEQQKIADCLSSVDALIAAQARKLDALKTHKKGLMQQLFPREGETQPRIRFPEFLDAGEWEEKKLGNIVEIRSGNSPSKYELSTQGSFPFVKVEDLNNCTKYQADSREYCDESGDAIPRCSVIFPKRGASIELNKIRITASEILIDTNLMAISPDRTATTEFLYYFLINVGLAQIADTSTIPQINNKHIIPFKILIPSTSEQESIADCLSSVDDLIAAQTQKLDALKTHKKGLMQQLFPSPGEVEA